MPRSTIANLHDLFEHELKRLIKLSEDGARMEKVPVKA
jgi:hypothetical protein